MRTFRQYIEAEMGGAPTMGGPPPAPGQDSEDKGHDDLSAMGRELDLSPEELAQALKDTPMIAFSPIHQKGRRKGSGPQVVFADKINQKTGSVDGRLMQGNMQKLQNPNGSQSNETDPMEPIHFRPIDRKDASYTYPNAWLEPFKSAAGGGDPGMPGMGALPPPPGSMPGMPGMGGM